MLIESKSQRQRGEIILVNVLEKQEWMGFRTREEGVALGRRNNLYCNRKLREKMDIDAGRSVGLIKKKLGMYVRKLL